MKIFKDTRGSADMYNDTAYFGWQTKPKALIGIGQGYKEAANQLVDYVLQSNNEGIRERFIFPIMFNYRNSIELVLKAIYMRACGKLCKGDHNLLSIWSYIETDVIDGMFGNEEIVEGMNEERSYPFRPDISKIPTQKIKDMLKELQGASRSEAERQVNPRGYEKADVWRYAISPDGELYFSKGHYLHYPTLKSEMNRLYDLLDYLYYEVDAFLSVGVIYL